MIIVLFHVLYLFGKFVYQSYRVKRQPAAVDDVVTGTEARFDTSESPYTMRDPEAPQEPEEKPLRFFPPAYVQRYVAVSDILNDTKYRGKLRKVVDFGCSELEYLVYLKNTTGVEEILCVDIDRRTLEAYKEKGAPLIAEYLHTRTSPLVIEICEGSVTYNDKKLEKTDAVICIELIEHLYPDTLEDLPYNIFGFIKPKLAVMTTPNADFNVLFPNFSGFRHADHKFEWSRQQFQDWAENITARYPDYVVTFEGICKGPVGTEHLGCCSQMAVFHRLSEKDSCNVGVEGLFKTVAVHEYPFCTDNRSDEQKILDEATYYIRYLSFQDCEMEEEVPLEKLLHMLRSFRISIDVLQTILEEAGWAIANRDIGPVVLVPPPSTYSDYSTVEEALWSNYSATDEEDNWNREPGPPINSSRLLEEDSLLNTWDNWGEPSIIIPQNCSVAEDSTSLFDVESLLLDGISEVTKDDETPKELIKTSSKETLESKPSLSSNIGSVDDLNDSFINVPSDLNESAVSSDSFLNMNLEDIKEGSFLEFLNPSSARDSQISRTVVNLNRTLDFQQYMSTSCASTSPEPYLRMEQHLKDDSMCNQSMSAYWMLNDSIDQANESKDGECKAVAKNELDFDNDFHSIYLNKSYKESEDSDLETLNSSTNVSTKHRETPSVQHDSAVSKGDVSQLNSSVSYASNTVIDNQPQFTSSPKIGTKVSTTGSRRSLDRGAQKSGSNLLSAIQQLQVTRLSSNNTLESSNASSQSNNDSSIHVDSTVKCSGIMELHNSPQDSTREKSMEVLKNEVDNAIDNTLTVSDTSTIGSTLNSDKHTTKEACITGPLCSDDSANVTTIDEGRQTAIHSARCNTESRVTDQRLTVGQESRVDLIHEGKTDSSSESLKDILQNIDSMRNDAKDVSTISNMSLVSSSHSVQSTSVLKDEKQVNCKDVKPNALEVTEGIEAKPSSPEESVDTPPNSWSPEVMDSGYPNSASAQDMTPEYDLSSIAQDQISDSEPPSIAEAPRVGALEPVEVENGDLANNNRDGEGNNMMAVQLNELEDLQPLIDVLENDLENENDIYALENDFPMWLLRILDMANPMDVDIHMRNRREAGFPDRAPEGDGAYGNMEQDEGFKSSSEEDSDLENNEMGDDDNSDVNENAVNSDSRNDQWATGGT
ncbi:hen1 methyltransferase isoform X1 [Andrena cerasifolii]|uniref:hen1 methyltransferase isoform X1 n=1 Tax=Andrena cerasifolii TaxID=2819439 RepID=UPI0040380EF8